MSHGYPECKVDAITRSIALRWLESIEHISVLEMLIDDHKSLGDEGLEALADDVYEKLDRVSVEVW